MSRRFRRARAAALAAGLAAALLTACGSSTGTGASAAVPATGTGTAGSSPSSTGTVTVFAAASLKTSFTALGETFQAQHPGATVTFNFAGSSDLVTQITAGAPADVFASADENNMGKAQTAGVISGQPVDFASNTLTIVTQPGNPKGITGFADLTASDLQVVVCAPQVPCGSATTKVEQSTGVTLAPVSEESSVTDVLNKVQTGQADAGLVYVTDAKGAGDKVTAVAIKGADEVVNNYPISALASAPQPELAKEFIVLVTSQAGKDVLGAAGFGTP